MAKTKKETEAKVKHYCYECENVTPVTRFNTMSVHGRMPTLGTCPYWKKSRCVLMSQEACATNFKLNNMAEKKETKKVEVDNLRFYEQLRQVPDYALKQIGAGRLKGMSDINPVYRIKAMTEAFGPCGIGWKYVITKQWEETFGQEVKVFTNIDLFIKVDGEWSDAIPGTGGSAIVAIERNGAYVSDEAYKMALTDSLSVAMKALGVAADVYYSKDRQCQFDTKYEQQSYVAQQQQQPAQQRAVQQPQVQQAPKEDLKATMENAKKELSACADKPALDAVYYKYPSINSTKEFQDAYMARYNEIKK